MKRWPSILAALIATAAAFAATVWFMDPHILFFLGVIPLLWIGFPVAVLGAIRLLVALPTGQSLRPGANLILSVVGYGCFVGLAIPANRFVQQRAVVSAKEYQAKIAPLLEAYRQTHGSYPGRLDQLPARPAAPRLLRGDRHYHSDGSSYSFRFSQPGGLIDTWDYDSRTGRWHLST